MYIIYKYMCVFYHLQTVVQEPYTGADDPLSERRGLQTRLIMLV